ncbi:transposon DNA-invertase [Legionella qingyii]|uniref:Recombinase family protein n=1 Tax=Legionella qingyii TaxID=2184757 RepID=A0A317U0W8_9GAMM|nr:recombinase family protein [Legionella qingyii]PWY55654.1 transposon DNA-invertase [Legionella qingyii]RUR21752.1 recombinase family protein [Legionella qingyii]RUR25320.1 recombinase family protein [Legionella qingyii]
MRVGYARVSTHEQNLDLQLDELKRAGCEQIFTDKISGSISERPGLEKVENFLREGDVLVVWRLDRLGRSLKHLISYVSKLEEKGIGFHSVTEAINTETPSGKFMFHVFGALSEFERNLIKERTLAGLEAARARGRQGGRPEKLSGEQKELVRTLYANKKHSIQSICKMVGVGKTTLYKYINQ